MKRLVAFLLTLCLLLGAFPATAKVNGAPSSLRLELGKFAFHLPKTVKLVGNRIEEDSYSEVTCQIDGWNYTFRVVHEWQPVTYDFVDGDAWSDSEQAYFELFGRVGHYKIDETNAGIFGESVYVVAERVDTNDAGWYIHTVKAVIYYDGSALCITMQDLGLPSDRIRAEDDVLDIMEMILNCAYPAYMSDEERQAALETIEFGVPSGAGTQVGADALIDRLPNGEQTESELEEFMRTAQLTGAAGADAGAEEAPADAEETTPVEEDSSAVVYVVITADSGKIRTEASVSGGLIRTAYKGETFELIREEGDWYVVDVNGRTGYIHQGVAGIQ